MPHNQKIQSIMTQAPVIAVVVVNEPEQAVGMAKALVKGGLPAVEITLRAPRALECIKAVADEVEGAIVGAGTVLDGKGFDAAVEAGSKFIVSPGVTPALLSAAKDGDVPLLPGASTASEMMVLSDAGYEYLKFFPATAAGGHPFLKSIAGPLPHLKFCPTGGITPQNKADFLALPNVLCVGGSWVAPKAALEAGDWDTVTALAQEAVA